MDFLNTSLWLWKHTVNKYSSKQLSEEIENINKRITNVYSDIANAHFISASDAILSTEHSNSPSSEIRAAIGHMREAFNILRQIVDKKVIKHVWIFFENEEYVVEDRQAFYKWLAYLSALISIMYSSLQESENADRWKQEASALFLSYFEFIIFEPEDLKKIDSKFAKIIKVDVTKCSMGSESYDVWTEEEDKLVISALGRKFINKWKADIHKQFLCEIDSKCLCLQSMGPE